MVFTRKRKLNGAVMERRERPHFQKSDCYEAGLFVHDLAQPLRLRTGKNFEIK